MNTINAKFLLTILLFSTGLMVCASAHGEEISGKSVSATLSTAGLAEPATLFSFSADAVPIKQALVMFARANKLNIVPDLDVEGELTVDFTELPLDLAMGALLDANGYYFAQEGRLLRVRNRESRLFHIDYIHTTRTGQGSSAVQISSGGGGSGGGGGASGGSAGGASGGTEGSTMTVTNNSIINFWGELAEELKSMISSKGSFTINSLAGTVLVNDSHRNIETISKFLSSVTENIVRQVDLDVEIYEVTLGKTNQLGINWQRIEQGMDTTLNTLPGQLTLGTAGGLIVQTPMFGPAPGAPGVQATLQRANTQAIVDALAQQGELKVISRPRLRTLNNQPSVVRVGQDVPIFNKQTIVSPGTPPIVTTTETVQTITVGTVLSITPQVSADGLITLDITPAVSRLAGTKTSASGLTDAPIIDIRQASSIVRVRDGATVIMGGLVQISSSSTKRKVPLLGDIPLLGRAFSGSYDTSERTELIFFVTPHVVHDVATEKSVQTKSAEPLPAATTTATVAPASEAEPLSKYKRFKE
jgi:MSHA type pilus biogenesis protein MshL